MHGQRRFIKMRLSRDQPSNNRLATSRHALHSKDRFPLQRGTAHAEIKIPSGVNPEMSTVLAFFFVFFCAGRATHLFSPLHSPLRPPHVPPRPPTSPPSPPPVPDRPPLWTQSNMFTSSAVDVSRVWHSGKALGW